MVNMVKKILVNINFVINLIFKKIYIILLYQILNNLMMKFIRLNLHKNKILILLVL